MCSEYLTRFQLVYVFLFCMQVTDDFIFLLNYVMKVLGLKNFFRGYDVMSFGNLNLRNQ